MSDNVYDPDSATPEAWRAEAEKTLRGKGLDSLTWQTAEDIAVKPLYTAEDLETLQYTNTMPGLSPYIRGPQATMYAAGPGRFVSTRAFLRRKPPMRFTARPWRQAGRVFPWPLTWRHTAAMTPTTRA